MLCACVSWGLPALEAHRQKEIEFWFIGNDRTYSHKTKTCSTCTLAVLLPSSELNAPVRLQQMGKYWWKLVVLGTKQTNARSVQILFATTVYEQNGSSHMWVNRSVSFSDSVGEIQEAQLNCEESMILSTEHKVWGNIFRAEYCPFLACSWWTMSWSWRHVTNDLVRWDVGQVWHD